MRLAKVFQYQKLFEGAADYQAMINAFPYDQVAKINPFGPYPSPNIDEFVETIKELFQNQLNWAKQVLKRQDRIIWWLKKARIDLYYTHVYNPLHYHNNRYYSEKESLPEEYQKIELKFPRFFDPDSKMTYEHVGHDSIEHYMAIDYHKIQNHVWSNESPSELLNQFREWEKEYTELKHRYLKPDSSHTVILDYGGYVWLNLNKASCRDEAAAGRHCGNSPRSTSNDRVLSFRQKVKKDQQVILTFVLEEGGLLGERKGYANTKPKPEYHPYIVDLLKQPFIKGMKEGRWLRGHDFELTDLSPELSRDMFNARPDLFKPADVLNIFGENSEEIRNLFDRAPTNFKINEIIDAFGKNSPEIKLHFEHYLSRFDTNKVIEAFGYESDQFLRWCIEQELYNGPFSNVMFESKKHRKELFTLAVEHKNLNVFQYQLIEIFGKDSPITLAMRNMKLEQLDVGYLNEIASADMGKNLSHDEERTNRARTAILEEAVEKGYGLGQIKLSLLVKILPKGHDILEDYIEQNLSTMSENEVGIIIENYRPVEKREFIERVLEAGNSELSDLGINHFLGQMPPEIIAFMIKNSLNVRHYNLKAIIKFLGVDHPQTKEFVLKVSTKQISNSAQDCFNDPSIFSVLNEDEALIMVNGRSMKMSMYEVLVSKYGPTSKPVSHLVDNDWISYAALEPVAAARGVDNFKDRVIDGLYQFLDNNSHSYVDITDDHLVLQNLYFDGAVKTVFTNLDYALNIYYGNSVYEDYGSDPKSNLSHNFDYLMYSKYNSDTQKYEEPIKYNMEPVYVRFINENLIDMWDEENDEAPEDADIDVLKEFLYDYNEDWNDAFRTAHLIGEESGYSSEIHESLVSGVTGWAEKYGGVHYTFARKEGDKYVEKLERDTIHTDDIYLVVRLSSLLTEMKIFYLALMAWNDEELKKSLEDHFEEHGIDFDDVNYIHLDEDLLDPDATISQDKFDYPDYPEVDESSLNYAFLENMPVDINYVIDCQKK